MKEFYLRKAITKKSSAQYWRAEIDGATVRMFHGQEGGAEVAEDPITYTEGKNVGKANETSPEYQCQFETERRIRKKLEKGYVLIRGTIETKSDTVIEANLSVPFPMLAKKFKEMEKKITKLPRVALQRKLNGNRCLINVKTGEMYSRQRKIIPHLHYVRESVAASINGLRGKGITWIDGELYAHGLTFNQVQEIIRRRSVQWYDKPDNPRHVLHFNMYDYIDDDNTPFYPKAEVINAYEQNVPEGSLLSIVRTEFSTPAEIMEKHNQYVAEGYEGIMIRLNLPYEQGPSRSSTLVKYKLFEDAEFTAVRFNPEKNNPNVLATITVDDNGVQTDVTPAMDAEEKAYLWVHQNEYIGKKATVKFQNKDAVTGALVFANLMGFRSDDDIPNEEDK